MNEIQPLLALDTLTLEQFLGANQISDVISALIAFVVTILALWFIKTMVTERLHTWAAQTDMKIDDLIINIFNTLGWPIYITVGLYVSLQFLILPEFWSRILSATIVILFTIFSVRALQELVSYLALKLFNRQGSSEDSIRGAINIAAGVILWSGAVVLILQNLGFNVSTLIAGLGIGGIAIAFALQNILGDLFSSFSIYLDKPFVPGDFIIIGPDMGTIKKVGIKSTRIETLEGDELVVSNAELSSTRVHNYKRMRKRRVAFQIGVEYSTPYKKLLRINDIIKEIIENIEQAELDRVHFFQFGDFSLKYEIVYFVDDRDYNLYMDIQQAVNLQIVQAFEKENITMAFPTQTVRLAK